MIDKNKDPSENEDQNYDEYQFTDLDPIEPDSGDTPPDSLSADLPMTEQWYTKKGNLRYALIAIAVIIGASVLYKFMGSIVSSKISKVQTPVSAPMVKSAIPTTPIQPQPIQVLQNQPNEFAKKVSALEVSQASVSSDVKALNNQISSLSTTMNDFNAKLDQLNQAMNALAVQASTQSQQLALLSVRAKPKVRHVAQTGPVSPQIYYYIQAVIPGRAWLVSANGATITVREGTRIPGYGIVKLIDPAQGRIVTSSGRIIAFSQQDT